MAYSPLPHRGALLLCALGTPLLATAQQTPNGLTTAVPILALSPDARSAALGEAGVALSPDANAAYYNAGKLGFAPNRFGFSPSYTPRLGTISRSGGLLHVSGYGRLGKRSTLAASILRLNLDAARARESAYSISYGHTFGEHLGVGVTGRYIRSNFNSSLPGIKPGNALAMDLGIYYTTGIPVGTSTYTLGLGASVASIGNKMTYTNPDQGDFLPTSLQIGTALTRTFGTSHTLTLVVDASKLLVPSPYYEEGPVPTNQAEREERQKRIDAENRKRRGKTPISGALGSFGDAPGGFREELREVNLSTGLEYAYRGTVFGRTGYYYENPAKGGRRYLGVGAGGRYQALGLDAAYMIPSSKNDPLAQTLRVSLHVSLGKS